MESRAQSALLFFIKTLITCYICYIEKIHIIICSMKCWGKMQNMLRALNRGKSLRRVSAVRQHAVTWTYRGTKKLFAAEICMTAADRLISGLSINRG